MGLKTTNRRLRNTWMDDLDFPETTEASNPQVYIIVAPECIYTSPETEVIRYFKSAASRVHAIAAVTDFTVTKWSFGKSQKLLSLATSEFTTA